jgi:uncharacterized protein YheU (UPF0270 family)
MIISHQDISPEALENIAKEYVLAHTSEVDDNLKLSDWVEAVITQVKKGELLIEFSQADESVTLKKPEDLNFDEG